MTNDDHQVDISALLAAITEGQYPSVATQGRTQQTQIEPLLFSVGNAVSACLIYMNHASTPNDFQRWASAILARSDIEVDPKHREQLVDFLEEWASDFAGSATNVTSVDIWMSRFAQLQDD